MVKVRVGAGRAACLGTSRESDMQLELPSLSHAGGGAAAPLRYHVGPYGPGGQGQAPGVGPAGGPLTLADAEGR